MIFVFDYFVECFFCGYVNRYRIGKNVILLLSLLLFIVLDCYVKKDNFLINK